MNTFYLLLLCNTVIPVNNPEWPLKIILNWSSASKIYIGKHKVYTHTHVFVLHVSVCRHVRVCKITLTCIPKAALHLHGNVVGLGAGAEAMEGVEDLGQQSQGDYHRSENNQHHQSAQHRNNHNNITSQPKTETTTTWHYSYSKLAALKQDY